MTSRSAIIAILLAAASSASADECAAGNEALQRKEYPAAVIRLNSCLSGELTPAGRVSLLQVRAQAYQGERQFDRAVADQLEAISLDKSRNAWTYIMLGIFRRDQKRYEEALAALKQAETRDEDGPGSGPGMAVYYHTGRTLHEAGRDAEAVKAYAKGLKRQAKYYAAYHHRGLAYETLGKRDKAKADFVRAAKFSPKDGVEPDIAAKLREYGLTVKTRIN
ncbi:MAG: tetratricopeptide repeat protein [Elusimicrobia bacterium]|nr:tetratricopeptide repeat protein [Elusimicrobiota bacterium]